MLKADGHRIRIATHKAFDQFVTEAGMEFFDIGGNPQDLMSYMVKSEFIVLEIFSLLFPPKEKERLLIAHRPWTGPGNGVYLERRHKAKAGDARRGAASIEERNMIMLMPVALKMILGCWDACTTPNEPGDLTPFVVDAIISNPPAFAHVHCAEALGVPLQLSFSRCKSPSMASLIYDSHKEISNALVGHCHRHLSH